MLKTAIGVAFGITLWYAATTGALILISWALSKLL